MDYLGIVKKAYYTTIKHRFLWIFGLFAGGVASMNANFSWPSLGSSNAEWEKIINDSGAGNFDWTAFWTTYAGLIFAMLTIFGVLMMIMFVISIISQGALIGGVGKISEGEKQEFKTSFMIGWHNFWRLWGVGIIYLLMILISLCVLIIPVCLLVIAGTYWIAGIWGILLFFVCLAFWILIGLISPYSMRVVVMKKLSVWQSIRDSLHFFTRNWGEVVVMYLILMAIGIAFGIVMALIILIVSAVFLAIGFGIWLANPLITVIYGCVIGLIFFAGMALISGIYNTFTSSIITLTYQKLTKRI